MIKILFLIILLGTASIITAQTNADDDWANPKSTVSSSGNGTKAKPAAPPEVYSGGKVKPTPRILLTMYDEKEFNHLQSLWFCKQIINQIERNESKGNRIIRISIQGFADGLRNNGFDITKVKYPIVEDKCKERVNVSIPIKDRPLAELRACQIQQKLDRLLKRTPYYTSIIMPQLEAFDYEDRQGDLKGKNRKVEVQIDYLEKRK